jgi:hypothetical protein
MGPQINIIGSFFPSWMLCALIGIGAALLGRWLFIRTGLDPYVGPPALVYSSLGILVMLTLWVAFFRGVTLWLRNKLHQSRALAASSVDCSAE